MTCVLWATLVGIVSFTAGNAVGFFLAGAILNSRLADEQAARELEALEGKP
jgi:hypothetical protein